MANSNKLRQEFTEYARNCILSRRPSNKEDFIIGQTAADSYVSFVEVDKLFSYNPEKWKDIKSIFDIDSSERIKEIYLELIGDNEFNKVDCQQASQYFRSNAIKHYYCFLKAREVVLGKTGSLVDESPEFYQRNDKQSIQQIFYGAPGTGKSHAVKTETEAWEKRGRVVRTTFHPDSDYSTFVGAYKPTTESVQRYDIYNKPMTRDGVPVMEQIITYEFVEQAFLQAYIDAWKNRDEPEFLIIEEINRGNCAQIFGDLFQLLDRGNDGYSEYAIRADKDLQKHLCKAFEDVEIADYPNVKTGKELLLPGNLYIRATMNTSDQSLFPIDSAFKRRWDWKYVPIAKGNDNGTELNWMIEVDGDLYDWWTFVRTINKHVFDTTNSEDKQLGFFFCKAMDNIISAETFVCKVIFYLWNDVFKDFGFDDKIFEDKEDNENPKLSFDKFYMANGKVNSEKIKIFLSNLGINTSTDRNEDNENGDGDMSTKVSFIINGNKVRYINQVCHTAIEEYVKSNKALAVQDIIDYWSEYTQYNQSSWIIGNQTKYESLSEADKKKTYSIRTDNNESLWVNKNGWVYQDGPGDIRKFIKAVNDAEIGIKIEENRE